MSIMKITLNKIIKGMIILLLVPGICGAKTVDLGVAGATYPVVEPDILEEMREKAAQLELAPGGIKKRAEALKSYRPGDLRELPRAAETRMHYPDLTYVLPYDIPQVDQEGNIIGILYPAGYTFNPLEYMHWDGMLVIIDGNDPEQIEWYKQSEYAKDYRTKILLTQGRWFDVEQELKQAVFYAEGSLIDKLNVSSVPAVVWQEGTAMVVKEIKICAEE
jgi:conjugal transfer pilus assembly protein TraW